MPFLSPYSLLFEIANLFFSVFREIEIGPFTFYLESMTRSIFIFFIIEADVSRYFHSFTFIFNYAYRSFTGR